MKNIKLFDYQEDMKERIEKALRLHRSVMVQMPTGTGKTVLLASVVESFLREHSNCNVWIVAHRRELVSQIRETIQRVFSKIHPSSLTLKGGSTSHPSPLSSEERDVAGDAIALPEFLYRQRSLCPQGAADDCLTQQSYQDDFRQHSASIKQAYDCSRLHENCDCLCGVNRLAKGATDSSSDILAALQRDLKWLGLWKFAGAVMYVLYEVFVFGLSEDKMIAPMNEKEGAFLLDEIMRGGNFGQYDDRLGDKTGEGKVHRYFRMSLRNMRFVKHYPSEAICEPLFRTWFWGWKKFRRE